MRQGDHQKVSSWLEVAQQVNGSVALMTQARVDLAMGQPNNALHAIRLMLRTYQDNASEIQRYASEILVRTYISLGQTNLAAGVFEDFAISARNQKLEMRIAMIDILLETGQREAVITALAAFMAHEDIPPRLLDRVLARSMAVMSARDLIELIDEKHALYREDPLRLLYKAKCLSGLGEFEAAREVVQRVLKSYPRAIRAQIALARLADQQGRSDEAQQIYEQMAEQGGPQAELARHELTQRHGRTTRSPTSQHLGEGD
jgi:tetratricopeptide (TPR) repeat protein